MASLSAVAQAEVDKFMDGLVERNSYEPEFHQAVKEVAESLMPFLLEHPQYREARILDRMTEPDRIVIFRVTWEDDKGDIQINRAARVQFNNAIGPYKGGLRFHPDTTLSVLKFLGFEQVFKNSLTGLPLGGAKGGSNFDPKGKSDREVMRFCQSLMTELHRHIGNVVDVPAGDIGVGPREISYMFGQYKRLANRFTGSLTGKRVSHGGSLIRTEATGYGAVYFTQNMLAERGEGLKGKTAVVSGSGNVALYCIEKLLHFGSKVLTASDSSGFIHDPDGIDTEKLEYLKDLKEVRRGRIHEYVTKYPNASFYEAKKPWGVKCDLAFPCATQNELDGADAEALLKNGVISVAEGANMPSTLDAVHAFQREKVMFGPGKAANAGGVAVSGLEQIQNAIGMPWSGEEVENKLREIMLGVHANCVKYGKGSNDHVDYVKGANIAGFVKVADAMLSFGIV